MVDSGARCRVVGVIVGKHGRDVMVHALMEKGHQVVLGVVYHVMVFG